MSFRDFVLRGNVLDLAVGVIMGGAFGKIVDSLVTKIINPIIGLVAGKADFSQIFIRMGAIPDGTADQSYAGLVKAGVPVLGIGAFISDIINFLILAWVIYMLVQWFSSLSARYTPPPAPATLDQNLLTEIRDLLKSR